MGEKKEEVDGLQAGGAYGHRPLLEVNLLSVLRSESGLCAGLESALYRRI